MRLRTRLSKLWFFFGMALMLPVHAAMAAPFIPWQFSVGGSTVDCNVYNTLPKNFFTIRIVQCVQSFIRDITYYFLGYTSDFFLPVTMALITLVIILFGIKLASQAQELKTEGLMLLIKIGLVLTFCLNFGDLAESSFQILEDSVGFVMGTFDVGTTAPVAGSACVLTDYGGVLGPAGANLAAWAKIDCIIGQIIGFGPSIAMAGAIFGMIGSMLFSGSIGIMVFFLGIFVLISLILFVLRAVYIYFLAYIMLAIMIIISPMIIPLVLLPQALRQNYNLNFFDSWLGYIFNAFITPLILFSFLAIAFPVFDHFVVDEENPSSLVNVLKGTYNVDGTKRPVDPDANPGDYYELASRCFKLTSFTDPSFYQKLPDFMDKLGTGDLLVPTKSGENDVAAFLPGCSGLDFGKQQQQRLTEIGFGLLQVLFIGHLLLTMMSIIPTMAGTLAGGGYGLTEAANTAMGIESTAISSIRQTEGFMNTMTGSNFRFSSLVGRRP